jgi:SpoVK/Ycf46/Vps4 family AAA+-type ATPase
VTYVYGRPQQDDIEDLMQVARLYAPAVVFVEDADTLPSGTTAETSKLLDLFDGLEAKHNDVMVVMTTNHIERIPAGMLRPGRLDHIIEINHMDDAARERFVRRFLDESQIDPELDMAPINEAMSGFVAAYVKAAVQNAVWYARSQNDGKKPNVITTQNLVHAAMGLRPQFELHVNAQEQHMTPDLAEILRDALTPAMLDAADRAAGVVQDTVRDAAVSPDTLREIVGGTVDNIVHGARIVDGDGEEVFNVQTSY